MVKRRTARLATIALSLLAGVLVVIWGGSSAMKPFSQDQLAAANCTSQSLSVQISDTSLVMDGLDPACAERIVRVTLLGDNRAVLAVVPTRLRAVAGSAQLNMSLPVGVLAQDVTSVNVAPLNL